MYQKIVMKMVALPETRTAWSAPEKSLSVRVPAALTAAGTPGSAPAPLLRITVLVTLGTAAAATLLRLAFPITLVWVPVKAAATAALVTLTTAVRLPRRAAVLDQLASSESGQSVLLLAAAVLSRAQTAVVIPKRGFATLRHALALPPIGVIGVHARRLVEGGPGSGITTAATPRSKTVTLSHALAAVPGVPGALALKPVAAALSRAPTAVVVPRPRAATTTAARAALILPPGHRSPSALLPVEGVLKSGRTTAAALKLATATPRPASTTKPGSKPLALTLSPANRPARPSTRPSLPP